MVPLIYIDLNLVLKCEHLDHIILTFRIFITNWCFDPKNKNKIVMKYFEKSFKLNRQFHVLKVNYENE